ncbi:hypothetical protein Cst04h_00390 [Corynebacterium striatum]|uniref:Uncharacterized protein n=1 Tax=Corynebacterium striatum TaxID=43770 RepID=A0ABC9ZI76_CORST|nr:hypothetical protein Cst04h_00390 [Corynebacterium striatum]
MTGTLDALDCHEWGHPQFHRVPRRVGFEGAGGATDGVGKQCPTWFFHLIGVFYPVLDRHHGSARGRWVYLIFHALIRPP